MLLLEAGAYYATVEEFPPDIRRANVMSSLIPGSPHAWPLTSQWTAQARLPLPRARVIGGGSSVNGSYFVRGHRGHGRRARGRADRLRARLTASRCPRPVARRGEYG